MPLGVLLVVAATACSDCDAPNEGESSATPPATAAAESAVETSAPVGVDRNQTDQPTDPAQPGEDTEDDTQEELEPLVPGNSELERTAAALADATDDATRARLLAQLAEALGVGELKRFSIPLYRASLDAVDDPAVRAALLAVEGGSVDRPVSDHLSVSTGDVFTGPAASAGELCALFDDDNWVENCEVTDADERSAEVTLFGPNSNAYGVAFRTGRGWFLFSPPWGSSGDGSGDFEFAVEQRVANEGYVRVDVTHREGYPEDCLYSGYRATGTYLCGDIEGAPFCVLVVTEHALIAERSGLLTRSRAELDEDERTACEAETALLTAMPEPPTHRVGLELSGDRVTLRPGPHVVQALAGEHAIRALPCLIVDPPALFGCGDADAQP